MARNYGKPKQKRISYTLATIFSGEKNGAEYQLLKVGFYDQKVTLNFCKGVSGGSNKMLESTVFIDYETLCVIKGLLDSVIRDRVGSYRMGEPYKEYSFNYAVRYMDSDSGQMRTLGNLTVEAVTVSETGDNRVNFKYNDGKDEYKISLTSPWLKDAFSFNEDSLLMKDIDISDSRLYALTYLFANVVKNWPCLVQQDIIARYQMNRLTGIADKLGIGYGNNSGGNYNDKNYRSNGGGNNNVESSDSSSQDSSGGDAFDDEPF